MADKELIDLTQAYKVRVSGGTLILSSVAGILSFGQSEIDHLYFYKEPNTFSEEAHKKIVEWLGYKE